MKKIMDTILKGRFYMDRLVMNKKLFFTVIGVLVVLLLLNINSVQRSRVLVKMYKVAKGDIVVTVSAPGVVKATTAQMAARTPGRVDWIGVSEGSEVKKGDILIKLDSYENALKEYKRVKALYDKGFASSQQLENASYSLDGASIRSPINGIVSSVAVEVGEPAIMGDPIVTVTNSKGMSIEIQIDQVDVGGVKKGDEVRVMADAYPDEIFEGKLIFLNNEAELKSVAGRVRPDEEDKVFRAKIELLKPTGKLFHGMNVDTEIVTQRLNDAIVIPREGVLSEGDKYYAYFVWFGRAHKKQISILLRDAFNVAVSDGVKLGDVVAVSNVIKLKDGSRVKIER
ncbi:MAG: efflux RND transporter periplasmic adaptor subunit [bacterium]